MQQPPFLSQISLDTSILHTVSFFKTRGRFICLAPCLGDRFDGSFVFVVIPGIIIITVAIAKAMLAIVLIHHKCLFTHDNNVIIVTFDGYREAVAG
jgi:hypothetical protein